jgi:hypothetical protein
MVAAESLGTTCLLRLECGRKEVAVCTGPVSYAKSGFAYGWKKSAVPRNDSGDVGREASVVSVGLNVPEYMDGDGEDGRVRTGDVGEACVTPRTEPGLTCGGGGWGVSGLAKLDTVLARLRVKINPGREGRDVDVVDTAACGRGLDAISNDARKVNVEHAHCEVA